MTVFMAPYAGYYDLLYADKDYAGEAAYIRDLLNRFAPEAASLIELGSGTGRHAAALAGMGYSVHGIEQSQAMLARANAAASSCSFSLGDVRDARLGKTFDAAISLFHVMSYQTTDGDLSAAFATARAHLTSGGVFLFDYWYGPAVLHDMPSVRIKRVGDASLELTRISEPVMEPKENLVTVNYDLFVRERATGSVTEYREAHRVRYLFLPEIQHLLSEAGFRLEASEQWRTGQTLSAETWYGLTAARAI